MLGRLSRPAPQLGKPLAPAVVDFVNTAEDLRDAVGEFVWETTYCTGAFRSCVECVLCVCCCLVVGRVLVGEVSGRRASKPPTQHTHTYIHTRTHMPCPTAGKQAKRLRQLRQMEAAVARVLERLAPLAAREEPKRGLAAMSARALAAAAAAGRGITPEGRRRLEEDLALYASLCGALR